MRALRSPSGRSDERGVLAPFGLALALAAICPSVRAATIVAGTVADAVTGAPVAGAKVSIRKEAALGQTQSDGSGMFRLPFDVGSSGVVSLTLTVEHDDYTATSEGVVVSLGRTDRAAYPILLFPKVLGPCRRDRDHAVVVGHFRPPVSGPAMLVDLASHVADTLRYGLLPSIQQQHLPQGSQPLILACDEAKPRAAEDAPRYARALGADAFLSGYVSPSGNKFKVEMTVGNRHDTTAPPVRSSSRDVDLSDPASAHLESKAYEAVLGALVAGYEKGSATECVEVIGAAERILRPLPEAFAQARRRCQERLPNRGLLRGGTQ